MNKEGIGFAAWLPSRQEEFRELVWNHSMLAFFAEGSPPDPYQSFELAISVTLLSLIQKGIEREKSFNFTLCLFSPAQFCQKILPFQ